MTTKSSSITILNILGHKNNLCNYHQSQCIYCTSTRFRSTVRRFKVRVPVLSLHRTSIPAISSIAVILLVMAP
ncbi:hypothetical protein ES319_A06G016100v1 [Gossypium barbadense]|uniref:Uncharacterized protein n=2 Tax=Gossypium TaxID=3633 RepID=A0A5J5V8F5_GOSBA|nr:hypothetical protein ES319_A06G016100v1 [Gossypium barbadense]TYH11829.1 hypothetical protein ES288_A06G017000v1 [Gossypium darwinii]